jgi:hypothetical protein
VPLSWEEKPDVRRAGEFADPGEYRFRFRGRGGAGESREALHFLFDFGARQGVAGIAARFLDTAVKNVAVVGLDCDFPDPSGRIHAIDFGIGHHNDFASKGRNAGVSVMIFELAEAGAMEDGYERKYGPHGEFGLMNRLGNVNGAEHIDGSLVDVGGDARYFAVGKVVVIYNLE